VTSFLDLFLAVILWNFFIFRFHVLCISTPFRLLSERSRRLKKAKSGVDTEGPLRLPEPESGKPGKWIATGVPSVSEHTTERLREYRPPVHEPPRES
jgi:hypothetical protein